jgi:hypothetical protein
MENTFFTLFIWFTYLMMFYVAIALPETAEMSLDITGSICSLAVGFSQMAV